MNNIFGYIGFLGIISTVFLASVGLITTENILFYLIQMIGNISFIVHSRIHKDTPILLLNASLFLILSFGIVRLTLLS